MTPGESDGVSVRSYLNVALRWKWLILAVTLVVVAAWTARTWTQTPLYSASTQLLYVQQIDLQDPLSQYSNSQTQQSEIEAVPAIIATPELGRAAATLMDATPSNAGYSVTATTLLTEYGTYSRVVTITGVSSNPSVAAAAANAYAQAFLEWGRDEAGQRVAAAIDVVESRLASMTGAARETTRYESLQASLLQLELLEATANGNFRIIAPANAPSEPFSPDKTREVIKALAAGLVLALGLAFLLEQLDTRVRSEQQLGDALGLGIVGHVPPLSRRDREAGALKTAVDPSGAAAEAYRVLRSNLEFAAVGDDVRVLLIASSVQGEGKSVIACNLALTMALAGRRVTLVDGDLRGPHVHQYLSIPNTRGVSTVLARRDNVSEALTPISLTQSRMGNGSITVSARTAVRSATRAGTSGPVSAKAERDSRAIWQRADGGDDEASLSVLPSGPVPPNPGEMVATARFGELIRELAEGCDIVIVDAPAMLVVGDTAAMAPWVDALLYVADPTKLRRPQLGRARHQLSQLPCRKLGLVFVAPDHRHGYYTYSSADKTRA